MALNNFDFKYKVCLHKGYFDKGMAITNYAKYIIAFFGFASADLKTTLIIAVLYGVFCYFLGLFWFNRGYFVAEQEVNNQFNLFVKEMRKRKI